MLVCLFVFVCLFGLIVCVLVSSLACWTPDRFGVVSDGSDLPCCGAEHFQSWSTFADFSLDTTAWGSWIVSGFDAQVFANEHLAMSMAIK